MFQLLITVNLKSSGGAGGAGVAISTTIASFTSERRAEEAMHILGSYSTGGRRGDAYTERTVQRLYNPTKK